MFKFLLGCFHFFAIFFASSFHHHAVLSSHTIITQTPTVIISIYPTLSPSSTPTDTPTFTATPIPSTSSGPTATQIPDPTIILTIEPTPTFTPDPTVTPTPSELPTVTPSFTPTPTVSPMPTLAPSPTITPTPTFTPTPTSKPTATPTPTITPSPTVTPSPTPTITLTLTPSPSLTPTLTPTPAASPSPTITPTFTPTPEPTATPSSTPTITPSPSPSPSLTLTPTPTVTKVGNDISYPQCGQTLPTQQGFGIVGVNGGLATTTNPCLSAELLWANLSLGTLNQSKVQLYVNTGNPGGLNTPSWPHNNTDPLGNISPNPNGTCDGSDSVACSWQYGWNRAVDDVQNKFIPAAQAANVDATPGDYPWWLDVETTNSWESGSDTAFQKNRADLEAMVTYFQSRGITVGIYSTSLQWGTIVNTVPSGSNLIGLRSWLPGAQDLSSAQNNCSMGSLTSGGSVIMTQFTTNNFDYDYSCL